MSTETNRDSTGRKIGYWVATGLVALGFLSGGAFDLARGPNVQAVMSHLGYPVYFAAILGLWKMLGGVVIVAPGLPRLKEWAYAGMVFDLSGAVASHLISGDGVSQVITPLVLLTLVVVSWALRPSSRILMAGPRAARVSAGQRRVPA
jgi:uncharacterized membrane protein YphA (DoxX/SURF4 family)